MSLRYQGGYAPRRLLPRLAVVVALVIVAVTAVAYMRSVGTGSSSVATFTAFRGPMEVTVLEGGSVEARDALQIQCEVQGQTKILSLIEEGYQITPEDVDNGLILIELDSKDLVDRQLSQELEYQNSLASLTDALEQYDIQRNQNESDIQAAELESHFARMDLEKYLGESLAASILTELNLNRDDAENNEPRRGLGTIDFTQYAHPDRLGDGEARQRLRRLEDELALAVEEVGLAETKLDGAKRLFDREFVTRTQLDNDQMAFNRTVIAQQSAETSRDLFIKYEFPKEAQKRLADYEESLRKLERVRKLAHSRIAQSEAKKNSAEARHSLQERRRQELAEQIEKCIIRAPRPGLVVYGSGERNVYRGENIEEGATVRERQVLLTIPDTSEMAVRVQVHESFIQKVRPGQPARIRTDAHPEQQLTGSVHRIAVLPDSQHRWLNPDLKVYSTSIHIDGNHDWLKPGMSAEVEIITETLQSALQVPVHAVHVVNGSPVCYVAGAQGVERRPVSTGEFNIAFIEIRDGLEVGESVLLRAPDGVRDGIPEGEGGPDQLPAIADVPVPALPDPPQGARGGRS